MPKPDWVTVSPTSGGGDKSVQVTAQANSSFQNRSGSVEISGGNVSKALPINQDGNFIEILNFKINGTSYEIYKIEGSNPLTYDCQNENIQVNADSSGIVEFTWVVNGAEGLSLYPTAIFTETEDFEVVEIIGDYDDPDYPDNFRMGVKVQAKGSLPKSMYQPQFNAANEMNYEEVYARVIPLDVSVDQ